MAICDVVLANNIISINYPKPIIPEKLNQFGQDEKTLHKTYIVSLKF